MSAPYEGSPTTGLDGGEVRLGPLGDYVSFHLRRAHAAQFRDFKRRTAISRLRPGWFALLSIIGENPGITPAMLSRASGRDKSTMTPILRDLVREKLVRSETNRADRRSYRLFLTESGSATQAHLAVAAAEHERDLSAIVGDGREAFMATLRRIVAAMERGPDQPKA
jgi:DNA-binding MarR family transcriptional regulator